MCCDQFTLADICLAVLLHRFSLLGLDEYFWTRNKSNITKYYAKIMNHDSFIKSLPSKYEIWKTVWSNTPINYKIGAGVIGLSTIGIIGLALTKKSDSM